MMYLFLVLIALSTGGIIFLVFNKLTLHELTLDKIGNIFSHKVFKKSAEDSEVFSMKTEDYWIGLIKSNPGNPVYYKRLGEWYMYNNSKDYAIKTLEYALMLDPKDKKIKKYLGGLRRS